jgi:signal transduction histidine kinase
MAGKTSKPSFFWQGVLILLPVLLMAGFGTWAILREREQVELDARNRAQEILSSLPYNFEQRLAFRMGFLALQSSDKSGIPETAADMIAGDADGSVREWGAAGNLMPGEMTNIMWTSASNQVWPMNFLLDSNGNFWDLTYEDAPQPPEWFTKMNDAQQRTWSALRESDSEKIAANEISRKAEDFLGTAPPEPARKYAEFIQLRAQSASQSDPDAFDSLLGFATNCPDTITDTGLPLSNLVMAELLRRAQPGATNTAIQKQLEFEARYRPSLLIPALLDEAEQRFAGSDRRFAESVKQLRSIWQTREVQHEIAEQIKLKGIPIGVGTITNFWMTGWFCLLQPENVITAHLVQTGGTNRIVAASTNVFTEVIPFSYSFLEQSFEESLVEARISVPDYFSLSTLLEGTIVLGPFDRMETWMPNREPDPVLAERQFTLAETGSNGGEDNAEAKTIDLMPSHPRLTMRVDLDLDRRNLLYAQQRQRQIIFGALIGFSTLAALIGFIMARRAFSTQLGLSEAKSNFVSSVSHELRAPIASVRLMAESLERGKVSEAPKQNEYFRFIVQECRRLSSLIENVLDFSRIEQGRKQYEFEPTDLAALTRETVKLMEPYATERGVTLEIAKSEIRNPKSELDVDGRAMQQALVNLMDNAIKHSPKGAVINVGFECDGSLARLWVEDHGPGIPPEEHEKIFERFYRLGSELRRETQGVGIGLSIVRHIVEAHGGKVTVRSSVGQGSRFTIELPATSKLPTTPVEKPQMNADERR